jgi:hypothetical protein
LLFSQHVISTYICYIDYFCALQQVYLLLFSPVSILPLLFLCPTCISTELLYIFSEYQHCTSIRIKYQHCISTRVNMHIYSQTQKEKKSIAYLSVFPSSMHIYYFPININIAYLFSPMHPDNPSFVQPLYEHFSPSIPDNLSRMYTPP